MRREALKQRRRGLSLIEVSVTIAVATLAMAIVGTGIASLLRVDARFRNASTAAADLPLLKQALRADLHAAVDCQLAGDTLTLSGEAPVTYTWSGDTIQRDTAQRDTAQRDTADSQRRFGVPEGVSWNLQEEKVEGARLVRLTFKPKAEGQPLITQLVAELGRHARLTTGAGEGAR
ncbi:hypothetical protein MalM25_22920 [Planctomycetes bacterium MalM25]|nr:hypothetical protein MalM25_22920 [Planctomycetes bacterium MalM25]